ncbi:MAG TPA: aminoacyl-tRNA hydrolase [Gemmatimonadales bacterium]|nr:aminoacyl-tRNA hydrolase [Gemmatimonadales bacterium]
MGLGNPGPEYAETRHNAGFRLADHLLARWRLPALRRGDRARVADGSWNGHPIRLLQPTTYMNRSGAALAPLLALPEFDPSRDLLVLVDEVALPLGRFRLRGAGSAGGHNGLKSIEGALRRQDYARLRIGVGPVPPGLDGLTDYVLDVFSREESAVLDALLDPMADAVETWLDEGIERAMARHNRRPDNSPSDS